MVIKALRFVNVLASAVSFGGQLFALLAVVPVARTWPPKKSAELHQEVLTDRPDRYLRPANAVAAVCSVLILLLERDVRRPSSVVTLAGLASVVGVAVVSSRSEFPINRIVNSWSLETVVPEEYPSLRKEWDRGHAARTAFGFGSLACFLAGALLSSPSADTQTAAHIGGDDTGER